MIVAMELYPIIAAAPTSKTRRAPHFLNTTGVLQGARRAIHRPLAFFVALLTSLVRN